MERFAVLLRTKSHSGYDKAGLKGMSSRKLAILYRPYERPTVVHFLNYLKCIHIIPDSVMPPPLIIGWQENHSHMNEEMLEMTREYSYLDEQSGRPNPRKRNQILNRSGMESFW